MSRILCEKCQRPIIACICNFICKIDNPTAVLVLQHPSEVKQTKGTVALLSRSLNHCQVLVGEDFSEHDELNIMLANHQALLLYPSAESEVLSLTKYEFNSTNINHDEKSKQPKLLIILDGTWKKAFRMFMLSSNLQALKQVRLPDTLANNGQYLIRKVAKKNALSSLEACCFALALLDNELGENELDDNQLGDKVLNNMKQSVDCGLYQDLLNKFAQFNQFQLSFRPST
ncbi:tRNA-uridine aminocarboxypropyltransferase [Candidatus Colwellia aromaticivorans]|uniref:tRNA-uridine aminocarboxypropyltransferase n=1 Tax=Candidatus Colwellia aromaticivorans TaxID=2267621 RepID=UPI000DF41B6B|nr:tRNA-uridine aminocarboxypropyltransferase [Candidatus Colwellia aromaticivorans]